MDKLNTLPGGNLTGTLTGLSVSPNQPKEGSLTDFSKVMRAVSKAGYEDRQKRENKITGAQFNPSRVSGDIFKQIMSSVEGRRGTDISKMYGGAVEAAKFDLAQKEEQRQAAIAQENKKFDIIKQKTALGINSVYIPTGSLADRNNNPGNLKFANQSGAVMGEGGFAKFNTPEDGYQALVNQVQLDQSRGETLEQFISKYAPPTENDTTTYIQQVASNLGVDPSMKISDIDANTLAQEIAQKESGSQFVDASGANENVNVLAQALKNGTITIKDVPASQKAQVLTAAKGMTAEIPSDTKKTLMDDVALTDKIIGNYKAISGAIGGPFTIPFTKGWKTAIQYDQLKSLLSLNKRKLLKGSGAISDFESKTLEKAAASISRLSSEEDFKKSLINIRGAFTTAAGNKAMVKITAPDGESKTGPLDSAGITDAIGKGYKVEYI